MRPSSLGILLMSSLAHRKLVTAFVVRQIIRRQRLQGFHDLPVAREVSSVTSFSSATLTSEAKLTDKSVWVLQFDGGSRGS